MIPPIVWLPVVIGAVVTFCMAMATETRKVHVIAACFIVTTIVAALLMGGSGLSG